MSNTLALSTYHFYSMSGLMFYLIEYIIAKVATLHFLLVKALKGLKFGHFLDLRS